MVTEIDSSVLRNVAVRY